MTAGDFNRQSRIARTRPQHVNRLRDAQLQEITGQSLLGYDRTMCRPLTEGQSDGRTDGGVHRTAGRMAYT